MIDKEHARVVEALLKRHGVRVALSDGVAGFKQAANGAIDVQTKSGKTYLADVVILALGVRRIPRWRKWPDWRSGNVGGSAWTNRCARAIRTSSPSVMLSKSRILSPANGV